MGFGVGLADALIPLIFAHRALAAAAILALTAGLIVVFLWEPAPLPVWAEGPRTRAISR